MSNMPALYIGHGAPMLLDDQLWTSQLREVAGKIERPTAILIVSAHWESAPITLSNPAANTPLFITLGAARSAAAPVETLIDGYFMGLGKRSFAVA